MIKGLGVGIIGDELNDEPRDVSSARYNSTRSAVSTEGIDGFMLDIDEKGILLIWVWVFEGFRLNWVK